MESRNRVRWVVVGADKGQREVDAEAIDQFPNEVDDVGENGVARRAAAVEKGEIGRGVVAEESEEGDGSFCRLPEGVVEGVEFGGVDGADVKGSRCG